MIVYTQACVDAECEASVIYTIFAIEIWHGECFDQDRIVCLLLYIHVDIPQCLEAVDAYGLFRYTASEEMPCCTGSSDVFATSSQAAKTDTRHNRINVFAVGAPGDFHQHQRLLDFDTRT